MQPKHLHSPNSTLDWIESSTPVPGYKASTKYPGWHWRKKDATPVTPVMQPAREYTITDQDGEVTEVVKQFVVMVNTPALQPETEVLTETLTALPTPLADPLPWCTYYTTAGDLLARLKGVKTKWETLASGQANIPNGKHIQHGDMVLFGNPETEYCGLVYAAHLKDLCSTFDKHDVLILTPTSEGLTIQIEYLNRRSKSLLHWRAYDKRYEHAIIKLTHP